MKWGQTRRHLLEGGKPVCGIGKSAQWQIDLGPANCLACRMVLLRRAAIVASEVLIGELKYDELRRVIDSFDCPVGD